MDVIPLNVLVIGDHSVGKRSLIMRYVYGLDFCFGHSYGGGGVAFYTKNLEIENNKVKMMIRDCERLERYLKKLPACRFRSVDCCVLAFDVTKSNSFKSLDYWLDQIKENINDTSFVIVVGNKIDLDETRAVTTEEAQRWCLEKGGLQYFETSALNMENIDRTFENAAKRGLLYRQRQDK